MFEKYLSGECVYGDDLDAAGIEKWFDEEESGYFDLVARAPGDYEYAYHALNEAHGFRHIRSSDYGRCLAIGCARGDEVLPLQSRLSEIVALEPADKWQSDSIGAVPARYVKPTPNGDLPFQDGHFDLITCFGVLHHIPNVSRVLAEMSRVSRSGAALLLREPIHNMGDWRYPRPGLTKNERGLPESWLDRQLASAGFTVEFKTHCMFNPLVRIAVHMGMATPFNHQVFVVADRLLCRLTKRNSWYHRDAAWKKLAPSSIFYVARRR